MHATFKQNYAQIPIYTSDGIKSKERQKFHTGIDDLQVMHIVHECSYQWYIWTHAGFCSNYRVEIGAVGIKNFGIFG